MSVYDNEAYRHFKETLFTELTANLKPVISSLTMLADDYKIDARYVVKAIEEYIVEVPSELKLLGLYVMDSIIKNLKDQNYIQIFQENIVKIFANVFECVDEQNRKALYKLRQTWYGIFTKMVLYSIDVSVNNIDPAWPITTKLDNDNIINNIKNVVQETKVVSSSIINQQPQQPSIKKQDNKMNNISPNKISQQPVIISNNDIDNELSTKQKVLLEIIEKKKKCQQQHDEYNKKIINNNNNNKISVRSTIQTVNKPKEASSSLLSIKTDLNHHQPEPKQLINSQLQVKQTSLLAKTATNVKQLQNNNENKQQKTTISPQSNDSTLNIRDPRLLKQVKQPITSILKVSPTGTNKKVLTNKTVSPNNVNKSPPITTTTTTTTTTISKVISKTSPSNPNGSQKKPIKRASPVQLNESDNVKKAKISNNVLNKPKSTISTSQNIVEKPKSSVKTNVVIQKNKKVPEKKSEPLVKKQPSSELGDIFGAGDIDYRSNEIATTSSITTKIVETPMVITPPNEIKDELMDISNDAIKGSSTSLNTTTTTTGAKIILSDLEKILNTNSGNTNVVDLLKTLIANVQQEPVVVTTPPVTSEVIIPQQQQQQQQQPLETHAVFPPVTATATTSTEPSSIESTNLITQPVPLMLTKPTPLMKADIQPSAKLIPSHEQQQQQQQPPNLMLLDIPPQPVPIQPSSTTSLNTYNNYLPPIRPRDKHEQEDSLLVIDGRSYRIQPDQRCVIKIYYHDHELYCDTRTKDVYIDSKRHYRMGDTTKEIMLNGRRVRLMYMGKRIELWIDGVSFHFRADAPPKQISITSPLTGFSKRYHVTIEGRTMDMFFNHYKVCNLNSGLRNRDLVQTVKLAADDFETHEIAYMCPPKRIMIDDQPRIMRYDLPIPCVEIDGQFYVIRFSGQPRNIMIDDIVYEVPFEGVKRIKLNNRAHEIAWGGPGFEVIIDGRPYELQFGQQQSREVFIGNRQHYIRVLGDPPDVKICGRVPDEILREHHKNLREEEEYQQQLQTQQTQQNVNVDETQTSLNVNELLDKLLEYNIINPIVNPPVTQPKASNVNPTIKPLMDISPLPEEQIPDLTSLDLNLLKQKYNQAIQNLYAGTPCGTCGMRFTSEKSKRYSNHYDWHFRQNKREKEEINKAHDRNWYYYWTEWVQYEELSEEDQAQIDSDTRTLSMQNDNISSYSLNTQNKRESDDNDDNDIDKLENDLNNTTLHNATLNRTSVCQATDDINDCCYICNDPFEIFLDSDGEWFFKDALRVGNRVYHPVCYDDVKEDQLSGGESIPTSPSISLNKIALSELNNDLSHVNSNNNNDNNQNDTVLSDNNNNITSDFKDEPLSP